MHDIIVIGGGASGLFAAIYAKDSGSDVVILEGTDRIGKKILTTGNGRCNITNEFTSIDKFYGKNLTLVENIFNEFSFEDTINFFSMLGLPLTTLKDGKMYPLSLQASSVIDMFRMSLDERDIPLHVNSKVSFIEKKSNHFVVSTTSGEVYKSKKVILSTGGKSYVKTGSDGSGYKLVKPFGHSVTPLLPALVQLKLDYKKLSAITGVKFDGYANLYVNDKLVSSEFGEILFTNYGISGIPILQLSLFATEALTRKQKVEITVNMLPRYTYDELKDFLENHWGMFAYRSVHDSLLGVINKKLIPIILKESGITDIHKPCYDLAWDEKKGIFDRLNKWSFKVSDTNGFNNAQVTLGGIKNKEVNPTTLESNLVDGLFFCGEVLDVAGACGGFNLQWAWSSGIVAGKNASK